MNNQRGTAVLEGVGVLFVITSFVSVVMMGAYLWFARGWIQYQSEQALYCLAESRPEVMCRRALKANVARFLPFGKVRNLGYSNERGRFGVKLDWKWEVKWDQKKFGYNVRVDKKLDMRKIPKRSLVTKDSL